MPSREPDDAHAKRPPPADAAGTATDIGALVRAWRQRALLTQEQLAASAGLNVRTIRRLENGGPHRPRSASVRLLVDALDLAPAEAEALARAATATPRPRADPAPPDHTATLDTPAVGPRRSPADVAGRGTTAHAASALVAGQADWVEPLLRILADENPLYETVHAQLVRVLTATGQTAAATRLYREVRARLVDELGVEPGPELETAFFDLVRRSPVSAKAGHSPMVPRQLPPDEPGFVG